MKVTRIITALFFITSFMAFNAMFWATANIYGQPIGKNGMWLIFAITTVLSLFFTAQISDDISKKDDSSI